MLSPNMTTTVQCTAKNMQSLCSGEGITLLDILKLNYCDIKLTIINYYYLMLADKEIRKKTFA